MKLDRFSALIEALYDAALEPTHWPQVAQLVSQAFEAESCAIWHLNATDGTASILGITRNFDDKSVNDYEAYYHQKDLVAIRMAQAGTGQALLSTDVIGEREFLDSEMFVDYAQPRRLGFYWAVGSIVAVEQQIRGAIGIHRPRDNQAFQAEHKQQLELLLPHLSRAMLLQRRLHGVTQNQVLVLDALERLAVGMIAVDARSTVLFSNSTAERLLRIGLGLTCRQGILSATDPAKEIELHHLIRHTAQTALGKPSAPAGVLSLPRVKGRPLSLLICPLRPHALGIGPSVPGALLIFSDPESNPSTPMQALMALYGLTPAEARLMAALVDGERLEDYAERQQISIHTARTQSKQVFAKTGHKRQADLVRDVLTNLALRAVKRPPNAD